MKLSLSHESYLYSAALFIYVMHFQFNVPPTVTSPSEIEECMKDVEEMPIAKYATLLILPSAEGLAFWYSSTVL